MEADIGAPSPDSAVGGEDADPEGTSGLGVGARGASVDYRSVASSSMAQWGLTSSSASSSESSASLPSPPAPRKRLPLADGARRALERCPRHLRRGRDRRPGGGHRRPGGRRRGVWWGLSLAWACSLYLHFRLNLLPAGPGHGG